MRDRSQRDLESIYSSRYGIRGGRVVLKESDAGSIMGDKPVEKYIDVIVKMIDLGLEVDADLISRVSSEGRLGDLITAIQREKLTVPAEVASAISGGDGDIESGGDFSGIKSKKDRVGSELDFSTPRFEDIPDEEDEDFGDEDSGVKLDPSMR